MKMKGIVLKLKGWLDIRKMSPQKAVSTVFVASVLLVVVGYGVWQFGRLISPFLDLNPTDNPIVRLGASDRDNQNNSLPNSITDPTIAKFDYVPTASPITELKYNLANPNQLLQARIEAFVDYRAGSSVVTDNWTPVSSVGLNGGSPNPNQQSYYTTSAGFQLFNAQACFGTWGMYPSDTVNSLLGGTFTCDGNTPTVSSTQFNNPPYNNPPAEFISSGTNFGTSGFYSIENYNLAAAGSNVATRLTSTLIGAGVTPPALTNKPQSDYREHRIRSMATKTSSGALVDECSGNNYIYIGTLSRIVGGSGYGAQIWRHRQFTPTELQGNSQLDCWEQVVSGGLNTVNNQGVMHMFSYGGYVYGSLYNSDSRGRLIRSASGGAGSWSYITQQFGTANGNYVISSAVFNSRLYVGLNDGGVYSTTDGVTWTDHSAAVSGTGRAMAAYNGRLYVGGGTNYSNNRVVWTDNGSTYNLSADNLGSVAGLVVGTNNRLYIGIGIPPTGSYVTSPKTARVWCLGCSAPGAAETMTISLPPLAVATPNQLKIENFTYNFNTVTEQFSASSPAGSPYSVSTTRVLDNGVPYYKIEMTGFTKDGAAVLPNARKLTAFNKLVSSFSAEAYSPPPATNILCVVGGVCMNPVYNVKLSFQNPSKTAVEGVGDTLRGGTVLQWASLGDASCGSGATTHLCLKPEVKLTGFSGISGQLSLLQAIRLDTAGEIVVEGNVVGATNVGGFSLSNENWLAIGGNINGITGATNNQKLNNYLVQTNSKLQWGDVGTSGTIAHKLNALKDKGNNKGTLTGANYTGNIYLNSSNESLANIGTSTFSSGPEGKIWKTTGTLTLTNPAVRGVGTIIVIGNLAVNGDLTCKPGTHFGVIATGSITFSTPNIQCGAYVALGGNIIINGTVTTPDQSAQGIFIARGNIDLPSVQDGARYTMRYDNAFAIDPAALFRELLDIVFSTTS